MKELPKCKQVILTTLKMAQRPLAVHEMDICKYSQNNIATRLSELAKVGLVDSRYRKGYLFKEWFIK